MILPARDLRAGDELLLDCGHGKLYYDVAEAPQRTAINRLSLLLDLSSVAPRNPVTGERMDWSRYEIWVSPGTRYSVRRAS